MAIDRARTARGAIAGAVAAGVWAAQQPLDKQAFGTRYDDVEFLGKIFTRGPGWYPAGLAMHLANGALFGAAYANLARLAPIPAWTRGPLAAVTENLALWPLSRVTDRLHPARDELAPLTGDRRALAVSTWRHLLFGAVLGELERRLNPPVEDVPPPYEAIVSSNGHGRIEHAVAAGAAPPGGGGTAEGPAS